MKITKLDVTNLRGFEHASFELDPSFTLLVGVNGVGKSSVLEALRISLSRVMPKFTASKALPIAFTEDDTRIGISDGLARGRAAFVDPFVRGVRPANSEKQRQRLAAILVHLRPGLRHFLLIGQSHRARAHGAFLIRHVFFARQVHEEMACVIGKLKVQTHG